MIVFVAVCAPGFLLGSERGAPEVLTTHRFRVIFDGTDEIAAVEIRGLVSETLEARAGGKLKPVDIVIVRMMQPPDALWDWRASIMEGNKDKRSGLIEILRPDGTPAISLFIREAWPVKWVWPDLNAEDPRPAREEIHIRAAEVRPLSRDSEIKAPNNQTPGKSTKDKPPPSIKKKDKDPFKEMEQEIKRKFKREKEPQN